MGYRYGMDEELAEYWRVKKIEIFMEMLRADQALDFSGIETPMQPTEAQALGHCESGINPGFYENPTPYS